ncbi:MAG: ABC transporter substrate-binding protein [Armatimonadetes bacterium]|nr:ABC transporter substrate-binding protein [Armatimonadota bacterium]MDW8153133.1 ABC transporter substrate-binding protein [Armatimonadota bacterium]
MAKGFRLHPLRTFLLLGLAGLLLAGVWNVSAGPAPTRGGVLRIRDEAPAGIIGIPWEIITTGVLWANPAFESLTRMDARGRMFPHLAVRWEVDRQNRAVVYHLREGVRFHDGSVMDADVVAWNLNQEIAKGRVPGRRAVAAGPTTVRVEMDRWDNRIWEVLSVTSGFIASQRFIEQNGVEAARWRPVGTGPFQLERVEHPVRIRYTRFPNYWQRGLPYLDAVEILSIPDPQTSAAAFLARQVDILGMDANEVVQRLVDQGYPVDVGTSSVLAILPDSATPSSPFRDRRVREALSLALDREALARLRGFGLNEPAKQLASRESLAYSADLETYGAYSTQRARELLQAAGYPEGFETRLIVNPRVDRDTAVAIQGMLRAAGIRVELEFPPIGRYAEYQLRGWRGLIMHPLVHAVNFANVVRLYLFGEFTFASVDKPETVKQAMEEALSTARLERHKLQKLHRILLQDRTMIPVMVLKRAYVRHPYVRDNGHMRWVTWAHWTPERTWIAR